VRPIRTTAEAIDFAMKYGLEVKRDDRGLVCVVGWSPMPDREQFVAFVTELMEDIVGADAFIAALEARRAVAGSPSRAELPRGDRAMPTVDESTELGAAIVEKQREIMGRMSDDPRLPEGVRRLLKEQREIMGHMSDDPRLPEGVRRLLKERLEAAAKRAAAGEVTKG
jgi:hypothetical protein